ncbi:hypothetical protein ACTXT7_010211 [Hymenolepis weldensis]
MTPVETANDDMKLPPSVKEAVKESSMPNPICDPKRSAPADDKCHEPEEIGLARLYPTTPHVDVQIWMRHRKILRPQRQLITSELKVDPKEIFTDTCYLSSPRNPETLENQM